MVTYGRPCTYDGERLRSCAQIGPQTNHKCKLQPFPEIGPPELVAIKILGPLLKTALDNQHVIIMTNRYSKLSRKILAAKITSMHLSTIFLDNSIQTYGISNQFLTNNCSQFVSKLFMRLWLLFRVRMLTTTTFHPQANIQGELYSSTSVLRLCHYVSEHPEDWDTYVHHSSMQIICRCIERQEHPPSM